MLTIDSPDINKIKIPNYGEEGDSNCYNRLTNYSPRAIYFKNNSYDTRPCDMYGAWIKRQVVLIL